MKYLSKEPMIFGATKQFIENYPNIDWNDKETKMKEKEIEEGVVYNDDGTVTIDIDLDDELLEYVKKIAEEKNKTVEETISKMLQEGLKIMEEKENEK